ncbi:hypothetical protein GOODEAATRI_018086 [Goodea atripinnis]|uniref:Uncharacterized protein n=1 Tax=Goodea atripinnis TaxID=208336 RepID=A0ABV0MT27_9TELE
MAQSVNCPGAIVADLGVCRPLIATSLQREAADVVSQAKNSTGLDTHPTFSRALQGKRMMVKVSTAAHVDVKGTVGVNLSTRDLPVLHAQPTGLAALRPLSNVPTTFKA